MNNESSMAGRARHAASSVACGAAALVGTLWGQVASAADQIFPNAASREVSVEYKQDGRTVRGVISNGSSLVATSVEVSCLHSVPPRPECAAKGGPFSSLIVSPDDVAVKSAKVKPRAGVYYEPSNCRFIPLGTEVLVTHEAPLLPGKAASLYAELPAGRVLDSCSVKEVRGRERRWFEF